jgi:hypothetical protein
VSALRLDGKTLSSVYRRCDFRKREYGNSKICVEEINKEEYMGLVKFIIVMEKGDISNG